MIKKLILNIGIVAVVVFILDFAIGRTLRYFYFKETTGSHYRTTYSMEKTKADILVFGASTANHHYVPEIFEEALKLSFYNTGRDGSRLIYNYAVFKSILKRYTPKIIILDIGFDELYYEPSDYDRLSSLLPYYKDHPEIREIIEKRSGFEKIKLFSSIYPFNSLLKAISMGNKKVTKSRNEDRSGYVPLYGRLDNADIKEIPINNSSIDPYKIEVLKNMITICHSNKIRLIIVQTPIFSRINDTVSSKTCERFAEENETIFIDYSHNSFFLESPILFKDMRHLNNEGAIEFSRNLASEISDMVKNEMRIN